MPNEKVNTETKTNSPESEKAMPSTSAHSITDVENKVASTRDDADNPVQNNERYSMSAFVDTVEEDFTDGTEENSEGTQTEESDELEETEEDQGQADLSMFDEPSTLEETGEEEEESFLEIYHENCLSCKSLIPFMKKSFKSCHYNAGNKSCPAQTVKIIYQIPLGKIIPKFMQAEAESDFDRIAKLSKVLASKPDWYQQRVGEALKEKRLERAG